MAQDSSRPDFWESRYRDRVTPWDAGRVPQDLRRYASTLSQGSHVLIPGCGSAYEAYYLLENGCDVLAIDFSPAAVEIARRNLGCYADRVQVADFFSFTVEKPFDVVYERAFLCALPPRMWLDYAFRMAQLLCEGGHLAGFFFMRETEKGPPFGISREALRALLDPLFEPVEDRSATESLPVFEGAERWQVWRRR
jgi:cyclopropane fatty-acyl-phospholipid synthase-like methyltransferase